MAEPRGYPEAIVRPIGPIDLRRLPPDARTPGVDYLWRVRWQVDGTYEQRVVPQPRVHLVAEDGRLLVHGVSPHPFVRWLSGRGHVLGASFVPGGFRPYLRADLSTLSGRVVPAAEVLGVDDRPYAERILAPDADDAAMAETLTAYLTAVGSDPDPRAVRVTDLVARAERDHGMVRVEALARAAAVSVRTLQRQFAAYVGIGPKWVLQRFRLLDAAAAAQSGADVDWAALAADLGFSDQAHLVRRFAEVVGTPPARYAGATAKGHQEPR